jgi:hypothetical protein
MKSSMKTAGPIYGGVLRYWHKSFLPIFEIGTTQETEYPFRKGKCLVFRIPFTTPGFYLGMWVSRPSVNRDDDEAIDSILQDALRSRVAWKPEDGVYDEFFKE